MRKAFLILLICAANYSAPGAQIPAELRPAALAQAKAAGLDREPSVVQAMEEVVVNAYLERLERSSEVEPSRREVQQAYAQSPLVRLHHLIVNEKNPRLKELKRKLERGADFDKLVREYSEGAAAAFAGDTDFRGRNQLPDELYQPALGLRDGEIAGPISIYGSTHWIKRVASKPFEEAFASYVAWLTDDLRNQKLAVALKNQLGKLP